MVAIYIPAATQLPLTDWPVSLEQIPSWGWVAGLKALPLLFFLGEGVRRVSANRFVAFTARLLQGARHRRASAWRGFPGHCARCPAHESSTLKGPQTGRGQHETARKPAGSGPRLLFFFSRAPCRRPILLNHRQTQLTFGGSSGNCH